MLCRVDLVRTDVSEEHIVPIIRVKGVCALGTTSLVTSSLVLFTLMMEKIFSSETPVPTRAAWRHMQENGTLHSDCRENLKYYIALTGWTL
jgi:hypothetical protein